MHFDCSQCKQKGFAPVLVLVGVLIIAAIAGGAYYFGRSQVTKPQSQSATPSPYIISQDRPDSPSLSDYTRTLISISTEETANWKIYVDDKFNISFKYPAIYNVVKLAENGVFLVRTEADKKSLEDCFTKKQPECNNYSLSLYFENLERNQNLSLKEFVALYTHTSVADYISITVAGLPALQIQFAGIGIVTNVFIDKGKSVFYLHANSITDPLENMAYFDKILSTFRFD